MAQMIENHKELKKGGQLVTFDISLIGLLYISTNNKQINWVDELWITIFFYLTFPCMYLILKRILWIDSDG